MPTLTVYNKGIEALAKGLLDFDSESYYCMLATSAYPPNEDTHGFRSDVTSEAAGTGYTAGGAACTVTVTRDDANNRVDVTFGAVTWPASTITARYAIYYRRRGGLPSVDELVCYVQQDADVSSVANTFTQAASTIRIAK